MSKAKMTKMSEEELTLLMEALGVKSRRLFAVRCGAQPNSAAFWFREESFPENRLKEIARSLHAEKSKGPLNEIQKKARALVEKKLGAPLAVLAIESAPWGFSNLPSEGSQRKELGLHYDPKNPKSILSNFETEDLVDALQKKGWIVQLSRNPEVASKGSGV